MYVMQILAILTTRGNITHSQLLEKLKCESNVNLSRKQRKKEELGHALLLTAFSGVEGCVGTLG